jgi:hypothetical protein
MYLRAYPSASFNPDNYSAEDVANMIRELVRAITTPNFDKATLNPSVYDPTTSSILDGNYDNWVFVGSTRDGNTLGSGAGQSGIGDAWTVSKGTKSIKFSIIHRMSLGENIRIAIAKNDGDNEYWLNPINSATIHTSGTTDSLIVAECVTSKVKTF